MKVQLKCLRCGLEYSATEEEDSSPKERVCPRCQSNSVRRLSTNPGK